LRLAAAAAVDGRVRTEAVMMRGIAVEIRATSGEMKTDHAPLYPQNNRLVPVTCQLPNYLHPSTRRVKQVSYG